VLEKARQDFSMGSESPRDGDEIDDGVEYEMSSHSEFFKLPINDQFYISSIVALETVIVVIAADLTAEGVLDSCLERGVD
jgi:hypothetical protein